MMTQTQILNLAIDGAYGKLAKLATEIKRGEALYEENKNKVDGHIQNAKIKEILKEMRAQAKELESQINEMEWMKATQE